MNRVEAVQATTDGLAILAGAELGPEGITEFPCDDCGATVDLTGVITVKIREANGDESEMDMTEAKARELLCQVGLMPPPVMCDRHERIEITTEALL